MPALLNYMKISLIGSFNSIKFNLVKLPHNNKPSENLNKLVSCVGRDSSVHQ